MVLYPTLPTTGIMKLSHGERKHKKTKKETHRDSWHVIGTFSLPKIITNNEQPFKWFRWEETKHSGNTNDNHGVVIGFYTVIYILGKIISSYNLFWTALNHYHFK